jgi:RNA polymerase sigma-70 factor (ECF subfamily)
LFESERQFIDDPSVKMVSRLQAERSLEARQRDIYDSHRHRTFSLAYYMTGNELEAEQILANTFVRAFRAAEEPNAQDVDAALLEELRERHHLGLNNAAAAPPTAVSVVDSSADLAGGNVRRTDLEEAVRSLPAPERFLFLLRDVEGYTPAAIAEFLNLPEAQVQRGLFAARIRLRRLLAAAQAQRAEAA